MPDKQGPAYFLIYMEQSILGFYECNGVLRPITLFGYKSRGLPGLNIIGPNYYVRALKEKIIYLTKLKGIPVPMARYVLCCEVEREVKFIKREVNLDFLDLPFLILFWSLIESIKIANLKDCMTCGKVTSQGIIHHVNVNWNGEAELDSPSQFNFFEPRDRPFDFKQMIYLGSKIKKDNEIIGQRVINCEDLFLGIEGLEHKLLFPQS